MRLTRTASRELTSLPDTSATDHRYSFPKLTLPLCVFPSWRADGKPSHVRVLLSDHPLAKGLSEKFDIPQTEMYADPFHVPAPDEVVFEEFWEKGEKFRSGSVWSILATGHSDTTVLIWRFDPPR